MKRELKPLDQKGEWKRQGDVKTIVMMAAYIGATNDLEAITKTLYEYRNYRLEFENKGYSNANEAAYIRAEEYLRQYIRENK